jgi:PAS domain S-box-containing protein
MHLAAITLNDNAELTYCNDYFLGLTGWARSEVIGCNWFERFVPAGNAELPAVFADLLSTVPNGRNYENEIMCRSQKRVLVRWNNSPVTDSSGNVVGVTSIGEDITEHRLLEREMLSVTARERCHLAAELHDGLGQHIFGASLLAHGVETEAVRAHLPMAADLAQLAVILRASLETCRRIACGLSPLTDMNGGIVQALRELTKMPSDFIPRVTLTVLEAAPLRIDGVSLDHIYRLAQEALSNALKHASAGRIDVVLNIQPLHITLSIEDNGVGLPPDAFNSERLGLKMMRHRARMIGGSLAITHRDPHGTRITLRCPRFANHRPTRGPQDEPGG